MKQLSHSAFWVSVLVFLAASPCFAQQALEDADWFERTIGEGVVWRYYLFEELYGARQSVSYIEIDLDHPDIVIDFPYRAAARERISSMIPAQAPQAIAGINGTYFNTQTGGHVTYLRVDGDEIPNAGNAWASWSDEGAIALNLDGDPSIIGRPGAGWSTQSGYPDILACGPLVLIQDVVPSSNLSAMGGHCTSRHPRSAVGVTDDNRLIFLTVDGRTEMAAGMTCEEVGEMMRQLGCSDALNLDGGGSTTLWTAAEPNNGVVNFPSDNGAYDHLGERSCSNAVAVSAPPAEPLALDARIVSKSFQDLMESGASQTVNLVYENIGTETWTADDTRLILARPEDRTSLLSDPDTWVSSSEPAVMTPDTVGPGERGSFLFVLNAPDVSTTTVFNEHFQLVRDSHGRFGPADSAAWMKLIVQPPVQSGDSFIVESRPGGQNIGWYSDEGMANAGVDTTAAGTTPGIGARYGSTYRSIAGFKRATIAPVFPAAGYYNVSVVWGVGSSRRNPITYHINHLGGRSTFQLDQSAVENLWVELGDSPFYFREGQSGSVEMTNEDIDVSGSMYANAFRFQYVEFPPPEQEYVVRHLNSLDPPEIDGVAEPGEWSIASPEASGFVRHDDSGSAAVSDPAFRMLFDDEAIYILAEMNNPYAAGYPQPPSPPTFESLSGDKFNFYLTPEGVSSEPFYRILLSPNPNDGNCYIWSQANLIKTQDSLTGADWIASGEAAYSVSENRMIIEYRVPWSAFDYAEMELEGAPADHTVWGLQAAFSDEISSNQWEYVNWEPDETPGYILGNPFGTLRFSREENTTGAWILR